MPIRALVIGAGETSTLIHLPILAQLREAGRIRLVDVCDLRQHRATMAREQFAFERAGSDAIAALCKPDIDAVYIFASAQLHREYGLEALAQGKHLFVEKPIAPSHREACALAQAARDVGRIAVGGHNRRFYRAFSEFRKHAGAAGWQSSEAVFHKPARGMPPPFGARTWLSANGIHALDALIFMMGGLPGHLASMAHGSPERPESFSALMRWADGRTASFLSENRAGARREEYVFHSPGETCRVSDDGAIIDRPGSSLRLNLPILGDGFLAEHVAFLDAIESRVEPLHGLSALAPSLRLAELIEEGFSGPIQLSAIPASVPARSKPQKEGSILVVNPDRLKDPLATQPLSRRMLSIEEVRSSTAPRTDVVGALLAAGPETLSAELLDRLPRLSVVGLAGLSFARHDPDTLLDRGIALLNASDAYADSVAEFALGLAILGRRRAFPSHDLMRRGGWGTTPRLGGLRGSLLRTAQAIRPTSQALGLDRTMLTLWRRTAPRIGLATICHASARDLRGASVGLVGWSANARAFAGRLIAAGARVSAWSEHAPLDDVREHGVTPVSLGAALDADIVSLHRGLTATTRHFLGAAELARLKPGTVFINVARGALVEPDALLERLKKGDILACLDTFEDEPLTGRHPLRNLPNVFLTSHLAGGSPDMHAAAAREVIGKIARHLDGERQDALSPARFATMT
jgi:phosphoglycerate dehydrogenase-like enzyme/predicted dehydrogenase